MSARGYSSRADAVADIAERLGLDSTDVDRELGAPRCRWEDISGARLDDMLREVWNGIIVEPYPFGPVDTDKGP